MADTLTEDQITEFKEAFAKFDPEETGSIEAKTQLGQLFRNLG